MTGRDPLPTEDTVRAALTQLRAEADTTGRRVSVLALAHRLGLANTTLRRRFPTVCAELAAAARTPPAGTTAPSAYHKLLQDNASLRRANEHLAEHLELARNVTRLPARRR
jgi:hypothetical protein